MAKKGGFSGLQFLPSATPEGFASKAVSSDNDANPSVIVRELIQNSLDAGAEMLGPVEVDFVFSEMPVSGIPGIKVYRSAFEAAKRDLRGRIQEAAEAQIERIEDSLAKERLPVLQVIDNGVGLDTERMNALLSDGLTNKIGASAQSAGSYGLGHYTAFPASDLQYILYGGVTKDGSRIMSGHAILASHLDEQREQLLGKDGYFIAGDPTGDLFNRHLFPGPEGIPGPVNRILDRIEKRNQSGSGSVVVLLGFNDFRDDKDPAESVRLVAAKHFYPVIRERNLIVRTHRGDDRQVLDERSTATILQSHRSERRTTTDIINGSKAYSIWRTFNNGDKKDVRTEFGTIQLYLRNADPNENTRISLYRSGMFITDQVPLNQASYFAEYRRFSAIILVNAPRESGDSQAFTLVRQAEGEKHASIDKRRLPKDKRQEFDHLFSKIREALKEMATKDDADTYTPEGFMELEVSGEAQRMNIGHSQGKPSVPRSQPRNFTTIGEELEPVPSGPEKRKKRGSKAKRSPNISRGTGRRVPVSAVAIRKGATVRIAIQANEDVANAAIRLSEDRGSDASCTNPLADQPLNFKPVGDRGSYKEELKIGELKEGQRSAVIEVAFQQPPPTEAVLKVDVVSRKMAPGGGTV